MQPTTSLVEELGRAVRNVPDFPRPGIQFKDITPILADPHLLRGAVAALAEPFRGERITKIVGVESRGFILGGLLADAFDAGFVPVRKKGKLPYETVSAEYALEYGTDRVEMHVDALQPGDRVLIHDDVIATGGTAAAAARLAQRQGVEVVGFTFLIELGFLAGRRQLDERLRCHSVLQF